MGFVFVLNWALILARTIDLGFCFNSVDVQFLGLQHSKKKLFDDGARLALTGDKYFPRNSGGSHCQFESTGFLLTYNRKRTMLQNSIGLIQCH